MAIVPLDLLRSTLGVGVSISDAELVQVRDAAEGAIVPLLKVNDPAGTPYDYATIPQIVEACLNASVEVFRYRKAPGGAYSSVDMAPQPFMLGRYFADKFSALLTGYLNPKGLIG